MSGSGVERVDVRRDHGLEVGFEDGRPCSFGLEELRANCPCAGCRSHRDRGEPAWPRPGSPPELRIEDAELIGAWGIGLRWNDGHDTGIYSWELLRRWCDERASGAGQPE